MKKHETNQLIQTLVAILHERIDYFKKNRYKRADAIQLITIGDCCWQIFRDKHEIKGKDYYDIFYKIMLRWYKRILEDSTVRDRIEGRESVTTNTYEQVTRTSAKNKYDSLNEIYDYNTALRHPGRYQNVLEGLLRDPWPNNEAKKLLETSELLGELLSPVALYEGESTETSN